MRYTPILLLCSCFAESSIKQYNDSPEIQIASHEDNTTIEEGDTIFRALVSDLNHDFDTLEVQWLIDNDIVCEASVPDASGESLCTTTISIGNTQIQAEVRDPEGGFAFDILPFEVESNAPPTTPVVEILPELAGSGDVLTLSITGAVDPDGDPISYRSVWFKNGTEYATIEQIEPENTQTGDEWSVEVYAFDGSLESSPGSDSTIIVNGAPIIEVSIDAPNGLYNDSTFECVANIVEPDGDTYTHTYEWLINGTSVGTESTLNMSATIASPNDEVTCIVTATDSQNAIRESQESVTLLNRIPTLAALVLSPSAPTTQDMLQLTYTYSDEDQDSVTIDISWFVDGSLVQSGSDILDSALFQRDQNISVEITPSDMYETGNSQTLSTMILNSPPQGAIVRIDPENPRETIDNLHCLLETEAYDLDGDPITHVFSWNKNGSPYTGSTLNTDHTGDGIPGSETMDGDIWECSYVAQDNTLSSTPATIDTEIGPNICYAYVVHTHEVSSCTQNQTQTVENCVPASGITTCYPQYCDTGETAQPQHYSNGSSTGAYCSDWGQCEGNPNYDVSGQSGWDWVSGYWSCTYTTTTVPVTVYGGANCGYYDTCDLQQATCGTPDSCTP
ncbi:MAG: hypothetical protein CL916_00475 [Deltaproteobacteria bacterium]|nr:hypothetical protein [Deltaproteobacteria bacterium]